MKELHCGTCGSTLEQDSAVCGSCGQPVASRKSESGRRYIILSLAGIISIGIIFLSFNLSLLFRPSRSDASSSIGDLRSIIGAQVAYHAAHGSYAVSLSDLIGETKPYLKGDWKKPRQGYQISMHGTGDNFTANADPLQGDHAPDRPHFFIDSSGVIRYSVAGPATADDTKLGE